jgi:hypothetical protein
LAQQLLFWHIFFKIKFNLCGVFNAEIMKNCLSKKIRFVDTSANLEGTVASLSRTNRMAGLPGWQSAVIILPEGNSGNHAIMQILGEKMSKKTAAGPLTYPAKITHVRGKNYIRARQNFLTCAAKTPHVRGGGSILVGFDWQESIPYTLLNDDNYEQYVR